MEDDIPDYMSDSFLLGMAEVDQKQAEQRKKEAQRNTLPVNPFASAIHPPSVKIRQEQARQEANTNVFHVDEKIAKMAQKMGFPLQVDTQDSKGDSSPIFFSDKAFSSPIIPVILPKGSGLGSEAYMSAVRRASTSHQRSDSANTSITVPVYVPSQTSASSSLLLSSPFPSSSTSLFTGTTEMKLQKAVIFTASSAPEVAFREEVRSRHETHRLALQLHSLQKSCMSLDLDAGILTNPLWEDLLCTDENSLKTKDMSARQSRETSSSRLSPRSSPPQKEKNPSWQSDFTNDGFYSSSRPRRVKLYEDDNRIVMSQLAPLSQKKDLFSDPYTTFPSTINENSFDKSIQKMSREKEESTAMEEYSQFERETQRKILHATGAITHTTNNNLKERGSPNRQVFTRLGDQYLGAIAVDEVESESDEADEADEDLANETTTENQSQGNAKRTSVNIKNVLITSTPTPSQDWGRMSQELTVPKESNISDIGFERKNVSLKATPDPGEEHKERMKAYRRAVDVFHGKDNMSDEKRGYLNRSRLDVDAVLSKLVIQAELAASYKDEDAVVTDEDEDENFHHHPQNTRNCVEEKSEAYYEQKINEIASYMKRKHMYCCWCIRKYSSLPEMANKCPGDLASQHDSEDFPGDINTSNVQ